MSIINQKTRDEELQNNPYIQAYLNGQLTDADLPALRQRAGIMDENRGLPFGPLRGALSNFAYMTAQRAGLKTPESSGGINDILMKEYAKQSVKSALGVEDPAKQLELEIKRTRLEGEKQKLEERTQKAEDEKDKIVQQANDTINTVNEIRKGMKYFGRFGAWKSSDTLEGRIAAVGAMTGGWGQEEWKNRRGWETNIDRLTAQLGFDYMTKLKNASRTGATGLGQLSEKEGEWIRQAATALKRDISPEQASLLLDTIEKLNRKARGEDVGEIYLPPLYNERTSLTPTAAGGRDEYAAMQSLIR